MNSSIAEQGGQNLLILEQLGSFGDCHCGGKIVYFSDYGVRCKDCMKLYGTWVEDLKKAKFEEKQRRAEIERKIEQRKIDDEMLI